jgi:cob(I)alamin adenosyltransferase
LSQTGKWIEEHRMKIYTGSGDRGRTSLFSGERVPKDDDRLQAYGDVDELNSVIGAVVACLPQACGEIRDHLEAIQSDLLHIGAWLATTPGSAAEASLTPLAPQKIAVLERTIDGIDAQLPPITGFILPGGNPSAAWTHVARTVCRRTERHVMRLLSCSSPAESSEPLRFALVYLNRLSDFFFVAARHLNRICGIEDKLWKP